MPIANFVEFEASKTLVLLDGKKVSLVVPPSEIQARIKEAASWIDNEYRGKDLVLVMILKGSICFVSDLMKEINIPFELEYVRGKSYYANTRGHFTLSLVEQLNLEGRHVLLLDELFDSGNTLTLTVPVLMKKKPASLKTMVLLIKPESEKVKDALFPDKALITIGNRFVIGYGLDYFEKYRGLRGIYAL